MKNLKKAIEGKANQVTQEFINDLKKEKTIAGILGQWRYNDLIPKSSTRDFSTVKELKEYLTIRRAKKEQKNLLKEFESVEAAADVGGEWKKSAAIASALNQSNAVLKLLYTAKNKKADASNRDLIGYGAGYGILPAFDGGVGFDCHRRIFEKFGFKTDRVATGPTFDAYTIKK